MEKKGKTGINFESINSNLQGQLHLSSETQKTFADRVWGNSWLYSAFRSLTRAHACGVFLGDQYMLNKLHKFKNIQACMSMSHRTFCIYCFF